MKRIIGYTLFWIALGMLAAILIPNTFLTVLLIIGFLVLGYNLFCC